MPAAARVGDMTSHGTPLGAGPGSSNVLIGGMPAWRATTDMHTYLSPGIRDSACRRSGDDGQYDRADQQFSCGPARGYDHRERPAECHYDGVCNGGNWVRTTHPLPSLF
jgi:hypothetical protein